MHIVTWIGLAAACIAVVIAFVVVVVRKVKEWR